MKILVLIFCMFTLLACSKEKKFTRTIQSKWNIDKISTYSVCPSGTDLISEEENVGKLILKNKKLDYKVPYQTTDDIYEGVIKYNDGTELNFVYEYLYESSHNGYGVVFHWNSNVEYLSTQLIIKDRWEFSITYSGVFCGYISNDYRLSK